MILKDRYTIESIKPFETYDWLLYKHYARRIPSISYSFGLFENKILNGICTFGSPPSNALCIGICGKNYKSQVIELNRLCLNDIKVKNITSYFLGNCLKLIPKPRIVVSYADTSQNHHGYIYQATNWIYTGLSAKRTERYDKNNPNKHSKTVTETMNYDELSVRERPQKHRYILFLGSKAQRKKMLNNLKYKIEPYPKGKNKNYNASYEPKVQLNMF